MEDSLLIVFYITGHGLGECALSWPCHRQIQDWTRPAQHKVISTGHATREIEIAKHLTQAGHSVVAVSGASAAFFKQEIKSPRWGHCSRQALVCVRYLFPSQGQTYRAVPCAAVSPSARLCLTVAASKAMLLGRTVPSHKAQRLSYQHTVFSHDTRRCTQPLA